MKRKNVTVVVDLNDKRDARKPPTLDRIIALTADDLKGVNEVILEQMQSPVLLIPQLAGHIIAAGGKRLRPMLTLSSARLCGYTESRHIGLAACVEFIHTATLLHDDVVDESDLRRGAATANAVWGNKASVLVGDFLFSRAFELMVADGSLEVLKILSRAPQRLLLKVRYTSWSPPMTQTRQSRTISKSFRPRRQNYLPLPAEIGAVVSDRPAEEQTALETYGDHIGMAFQLIDDVLDYSAQQTTLGKAVA